MCSYTATQQVVLKALTLAAGIVALGIGAHAFQHSQVNKSIRESFKTSEFQDQDVLIKEELFIVITSICIILSTMSFMLVCSKQETVMKSNVQLVDSGFHMIAAFSLIVAGSLMLTSAVDIHLSSCKNCQHFEEKIVAAVLAITDGLLCGFIGVSAFRSRGSYENLSEQ